MDQRICASCGAANPTDHQFCGGCGSALHVACPSCGATPSSPTQRFCGKCGTELDAHVQAATGDPARAGGELRRVTVAFVDLVGWTSLSEQREPEVLRELLSGYFELARTVVERYGGTVEKFIGDAVMAVWGARTAREDDPERAVRAALDLVAGVPTYGEQAGVPELTARAGVVTGRVAAVDNATEGIVVGDRVNAAARVQATAGPGEVLVDDDTRRLTEAAVSFVEAGTHEVKGKTNPLVLWRALRVVAGVGGRARVDGLETSLVGRDRELASVKELFHATAEDQRARLLLVTGLPGVGKSRLRWEFSTYTDGVAGSVFWHQGRCLAYGDDVSFWALAEMLRDRFGIEADTAPESVVARVADALPAWVPDPTERAFLTPRLATLIGADGEGFGRQDLFGAWRLFFQRLSETAPVVLVVEDLQWADVPLLDFLEHLLDYASGSRIFVLGLARPDLAERRQGWPVGRQDVTTLPLEPLSDALMQRLVDELVPGLTPEARDRVVGRAEGVPLYAVETVRSLVDRGAVAVQDGRHVLVGDVGELDEVPTGLAGLIASRLDALPAPERSLVQGLAVLGLSFPRSAVAAATDVPEETLDILLAALVRKRVLTVRDDPLSVSSGQYMFVQSMLRSVAYETLSRRERRARHLRLAEYLEPAGEESAELAAAHYQQALLADPDSPDAEQTRDRARLAFERAGRRAGSVGAPDAAEQAYRSAAAIAPDEPTRMRLIGLAAGMARQAGRFPDALLTLDELHDSYLAAGDEDAALEALADSSWCRQELGRYREVVERVAPRLAQLATDRADEPVARLEVQLGAALSWLGDETRAHEHLERALALGAALDLPSVQAFAGSMRGIMLVNSGRTGEGLAMHRWAADLKVGDDDMFGEYHVRGNISDLLTVTDRPGAEEECRQVLSLTQRLGNRSGEAYAQVNIAHLLLLFGRWSEIEKCARTALSLRSEPATHLWARSRLMLLYLLRGERAAALAEGELTAKLADAEDTQSRPVGRAALGVVQTLRGDLAAGLETAQAATREALTTSGPCSDVARVAWVLATELAVASERDDVLGELVELVASRPPGHVPPFLRAETARLRAGVAQRSGAPLDSVETDLTTALRTMEELGYPYWRALAQLDLGRFLADDDRAEEAEKPLLSAAETFEELGAQPALDRTRTLLGSLPI